MYTGMHIIEQLSTAHKHTSIFVRTLDQPWLHPNHYPDSYEVISSFLMRSRSYTYFAFSDTLIGRFPLTTVD